MSKLHNLIVKQMERARRPDGSFDIDRLTRMVSGAYDEADLERKRTDHSIRKMVEELDHRAGHDIMTGLANRTLFASEIRRRIAPESDTQQLAVLFLDLDRFKEVNDTMGHPAGDELLRQVSSRLQEVVGDRGLVARLGGDEFAIAQWNNVGRDHAGDKARRLIARISEPYEIEGKRTIIGASVGISLAPENGRTPDDLLRCADMALYRSKQSGKGQFCFFVHEMAHALESRKSLEEGLRAAIETQNFQLLFQPIVEVGTMRARNFEALLRWRDPARGLVSPADFIPVAETTGLIVPIGDWVIRNACIEARRFPADAAVSVNISPVQLKSDDIVASFASALKISGLEPWRLEVEITENVLLEEDRKTSESLKRLRDLGIGFALDDFGTGHSSLSYLQKFHFDKIKIDRSFCSSINTNPVNAALVRAVASLGRDLGIDVVAEGVETAQESSALIAEGCGYLQGYYYGRPAPAVDIVANEALAMARQALSMMQDAEARHALKREIS